MLYLSRFFGCFTALMLLFGCSALQGGKTSLLAMSLARPKDVTLTLSEVQASPWDILYVRAGKQGRATMVLAFIEHDQFKWVSADNAMLVIEEGRVVRTVGFTNDLLYLSHTAEDPIRHNIKHPITAHWTRLTDWQSQHFSGYQLSSSFDTLPSVDLVYFDRTISTQLVRELVTFTDTGQQVENLFWFETASGQLIQSRQQLGPDWPVLEITHLSQLARLVTPL